MIFSLNLLPESGLHPLHVSLTNIEYNKKEKSFEMACKIFTDDFEEILKRKYDVSMKFGQDDEHKNSKKYCLDYINENFFIKFDGLKQEDIKYLKKEQNFEAIWLFFSFIPPENFKSVEISDRIMFDMFNDQKNMVIFNCSDKQKAFMLNHRKEKVVFEL